VIALDTSALLAIAFKEPEREVFAHAIRSNRCLIGAANVLECHMVLRERQGETGVKQLDDFLTRAQVATIGFDNVLLPIARLAFDRYGKGRHPAGLNFGDCMSYAIAKAKDVPLLFKGNDFHLTDIRPALP
jgi:ribonuclease VapC